MPTTNITFNKGNGHSKFYLNTKILLLLAELAYEDGEYELMSKFIEMKNNQGVNTDHIKCGSDLAIFMYDHGYSHNMGTDTLKKFFEFLYKLRGI